MCAYSVCVWAESLFGLNCTYIRICMYVQYVHMYFVEAFEWLGDLRMQWNLSIKVTLDEGHLSNEDAVCSLNHTELCTKLPLN